MCYIAICMQTLYANVYIYIYIIKCIHSNSNILL